MSRNQRTGATKSSEKIAKLIMDVTRSPAPPAYSELPETTSSVSAASVTEVAAELPSPVPVSTELPEPTPAVNNTPAAPPAPPAPPAPAAIQPEPETRFVQETSVQSASHVASPPPPAAKPEYQTLSPTISLDQKTALPGYTPFQLPASLGSKLSENPLVKSALDLLTASLVAYGNGRCRKGMVKHARRNLINTLYEAEIERREMTDGGRTLSSKEKKMIWHEVKELKGEIKDLRKVAKRERKGCCC